MDEADAEAVRPDVCIGHGFGQKAEGSVAAALDLHAKWQSRRRRGETPS